MHRLVTVAAAAAALLGSAAALAEPSGGRVTAGDARAASTLFADEALRICIDTAANPQAIRRLASDEHWAAIDPATVPARNRIVLKGKKKSQDRVIERTAAWTVEKQGLTLTVGMFDIPDVPRLGHQCELMAWDLDASAVEAALKSDPRLKDQSLPDFPLKAYAVAGTSLNVSYVPGDQGSRVLHAFTVQ
jgi:hypothetical protein